MSTCHKPGEYICNFLMPVKLEASIQIDRVERGCVGRGGISPAAEKVQGSGLTGGAAETPPTPREASIQPPQHQPHAEPVRIA